jgi:hypothetical protein
MNRRNALKNMGLSLGYVVATPTLVSIVQSCKAENALKWTPDFFSKEEGTVITHLVDLILPKTDSPSASEVQVDIFIDRFIDQVMERKDQELLKLGMHKFIGKALAFSGKESVRKLKSEEIEAVLSASVKISKEAQKANDKAIENYREALQGGEKIQLEDEVAQYAFAKEIRGITIFGYKSSEFIGKEVMEYLPVPGTYVACGDTEELTGGKAWSL